MPKNPNKLKNKASQYGFSGVIALLSGLIIFQTKGIKNDLDYTRKELGDRIDQINERIDRHLELSKDWSDSTINESDVFVVPDFYSVDSSKWFGPYEWANPYEWPDSSRFYWEFAPLVEEKEDTLSPQNFLRFPVHSVSEE